MPTLTWIGKDKVINHHHDVPFRVLDAQYTYGTQHPASTDHTSRETDNRIIHGDNLEALKALLPYYEGRIKCIYIDPPYNTGNEGWVYNDNVSDPKLKRWLGKVVGKESEDLSRHDKWLCMMYPRLQLLHRLLSDDGVIFVAIDNFEYDYLSLLLDEIFGRVNRIETLIWKKSYGGGSKSKHTVNLHEYIHFCAKNIDKIGELILPPDESVLKYYKYQDEKFELRGPFRLQPLATTSMDDRPNLRYPITYKSEEIWPEKQWQWSRDRVNKALINNDLVIEKKKDKWSVNYKQYLRDEDGKERGSKLFSLIEGIYTQQGTSQLREVLGKTDFTFPKPAELIQNLLKIATNPDGNDIILDSFAGSGTTAHAVLNLNKQDGGNRQFILVEMEDYAETITAERVRRVIDGYGDKEGTGGGFTYYELGQALFTDDGLLNEDLPLDRIREYVWYSETRTALPHSDASQSADETPDETPHFLGRRYETAYYFYYEQDELTTLDYDFLATVQTRAEQYVSYADNCLINKEWLQQRHIIFKKIPRDISRF